MSKDKYIEEGQIDLFKYITTTDFDSPEVIEEMKVVEAQIKEVLEGQKIDYSKMLTVFNIEKFCTHLPKSGSTFGMKYGDFIRYGILYGAMAQLYNQNSKQ